MIAFSSEGASGISGPIGDCCRILAAADEILAQGEGLLAGVSAAGYVQPVAAAFNGSIGGHYRHCLDHFACLLRGLQLGVVDYDHRERDLRIEKDPAYALSITTDLRRKLAEARPERLTEAVGARCEVSYAHGCAPLAGSTVGREFVYVIAHCIHHYALISVMACLAGVKLPVNFGVAPSTVAHLKYQRTIAN